MPKGFFITGTDTGVGKTVAAGVLLRAAAMLGIRACGMKPVETGCSGNLDMPMPSDGTFLKNVSDMDEPINHIVPYCLKTPLSPMIAAEIEGITIEPKIIKNEFDRLARGYEAIIVEGIGGLLVPIKKDYSVLNMIRDFELPLIVVSRPSLGTINHTLLTVKYAIKEGLLVAGIIINYSRPPEGNLAEETNEHALRALTDVPIIGTIPYLDNMGNETLEKTAIKNLDLSIIKKYL